MTDWINKKYYLYLLYIIILKNRLFYTFVDIVNFIEHNA